jgi:hypothetical protein
LTESNHLNHSKRFQMITGSYLSEVQILSTHKYGMHRGKMPAFRQVKKIKYYRDGDCDEVAEELGKVYDNIIYMNIHGSTYHRGRDIVRSRIGSWSAGCLCFDSNLFYEELISILKPQKILSFALINEF